MAMSLSRPIDSLPFSLSHTDPTGLAGVLSAPPRGASRPDRHLPTVVPQVTRRLSAWPEHELNTCCRGLDCLGDRIRTNLLVLMDVATTLQPGCPGSSHGHERRGHEYDHKTLREGTGD